MEIYTLRKKKYDKSAMKSDLVKCVNKKSFMLIKYLLLCL